MTDTVKWSDLSARERDAMVAEKVMGWGHVSYERGDAFRWLKRDSGRVYGSERVLRYTTDIAAAWDVVSKMRERWKGALRVTVTTDGEGTGCDFVALTGHGRIGRGEADTAPEAIAIAAMRACGVEVLT